MAKQDHTIHIEEMADLVTESGWKFFLHHKELIEFVMFVIFQSVRMDEVVDIAKSALAGSDPKEWKSWNSDRIRKGGDNIDALRNHRQIILETMVCRAADNFFVYISNLLAEIFLAKPETLKSEEKITIEFILNQENMNSLVAALAEKKVERLSYQSIKDLTDYFENRLGIKIFRSVEDQAQGIRVLETRNLIVHNRGIIDTKFESKVSGYSENIGERLKLDVDGIFSDLELLARIVSEVDQFVFNKFGLIESTKDTKP